MGFSFSRFAQGFGQQGGNIGAAIGGINAAERQRALDEMAKRKSDVDIKVSEAALTNNAQDQAAQEAARQRGYKGTEELATFLANKNKAGTITAEQGISPTVPMTDTGILPGGPLSPELRHMATETPLESFNKSNLIQYGDVPAVKTYREGLESAVGSKQKEREFGLKEREMDLRESEMGMGGEKKALELKKLKQEVDKVDPSRPMATTISDDNRELWDTLHTKYQKENAIHRGGLDSVNKLLTMIDMDSGIADVGSIFTLIKSFDPTSTVRESEFKLAEDAAGVYNRLLNVGQKVKDGNLLGSTARAEIKALASELGSYYKESVGRVDNRFTYLSESARIDPKLVVDPSAGFLKQKAEKPVSGLTPEKESRRQELLKKKNG